MNFLAIGLLSVLSLSEAFILFCNLVLQKKFIHFTYLVNLSCLESVSNVLKDILEIFFPELYRYLKDNDFNYWETIWLEYVPAMFINKFSLQKSFIIWDYIFLYDFPVIFQFFYSMFWMISQKIKEINPNQICKELNRIVNDNFKHIIEKMIDIHFSNSYICKLNKILKSEKLL